MRSASVILVYSCCLLFPDIICAGGSSVLHSDVASQQIASDLQKVEAVLRQTIEESSDPATVIPAHEKLAILCIQNHRSSEAELLIQKLQSQYPASPETADALYAVALHWNWNGEPQKSLNLHRYNSKMFAKTQKGMWSHGAIVHYFIEKKNFDSAKKEFIVMSNRFKDQPTWPQEIHQFAEKYRTTDEPARALELHRFNADHSPAFSMHSMWSQGAIVHHYIRHKEFAAAERETDVLIKRFSKQPTLPQELNQIANMLKSEGQVDSAMQLHRLNATQSQSSSKYSMWSQGALIHHLIEQKDLYPAEVEYKEMLSRFADQPTLPQEIYYCALKYHSVGNKEKALELHRYNAVYSSESSIHSMQSQGAIVHHCIETKDYEAAKHEIDFLTSRFSQHETFPQELYQFALKYQAVGASEQALELHRQNATQSSADSMYSMWSQGALIHHFINQQDFAAAQQDCEAMISRFADQPTLPHELQLIADKYQGAGQYALSGNLCQYGLAAYGDVDSKLKFKEVVVKILLAEKKNEQAELACSELLSLCTNQSQTAKILTHLGDIYHHTKHWDQAVTYFQKAMETATSPAEKLDAHAGLAKALIRASSNSAMSPDVSEISALLDAILAEYRGCKEVGLRGVQIGEEYYYLGREALDNANGQKAKEYFVQATSIWNSVLQADIGSREECYYLTGICCYEVGDYVNAMKAFEQVHKTYPQFQYADYCLFMQGYCFEKTLETETVPQKEATLALVALYSQLVSEYPDSQYSELAKRRLDTYSSF